MLSCHHARQNSQRTRSQCHCHHHLNPRLPRKLRERAPATIHEARRIKVSAPSPVTLVMSYSRLEEAHVRIAIRQSFALQNVPVSLCSTMISSSKRDAISHLASPIIPPGEQKKHPPTTKPRTHSPNHRSITHPSFLSIHFAFHPTSFHATAFHRRTFAFSLFHGSFSSLFKLFRLAKSYYTRDETVIHRGIEGGRGNQGKLLGGEGFYPRPFLCLTHAYCASFFILFFFLPSKGVERRCREDEGGGLRRSGQGSAEGTACCLLLLMGRGCGCVV